MKALFFIATALLAASPALANDYELLQRPALTDFPVAVMRPTGDANCEDPDTGTPGQCPFALDLTPRGNTAPFGDHGYVWLDACDVDVMAIDESEITAPSIFNCARIGINDDAIWMGSISYGTGTEKPVDLIQDGDKRIRLSTTGIELFNTMTSGTTATMPGVGNSETGVSVVPDGSIMASRSGWPALILNRTTTGVVMQFRMAGTQVGTITVTSTGVTLSGFKQIDDLESRVSALEAHH